MLSRPVLASRWKSPARSLAVSTVIIIRAVIHLGTACAWLQDVRSSTGPLVVSAARAFVVFADVRVLDYHLSDSFGEAFLSPWRYFWEHAHAGSVAYRFEAPLAITALVTLSHHTIYLSPLETAGRCG